MSDLESEKEVTTNDDDDIDSKKCKPASNYVANKPVKNPSLEEKLLSKMFSYSRETLCIFLAVFFSLSIAAFHNTPPKISKPPPAKPLFNESSIVIDFYKGQLNAMVDRASNADYTFVMYYAPWDSDSQILRNEFETVAYQYQSQVFFTAINCWHPGSECRAQYSKIQSYPVFVLYLLRNSGIQYRGICTAPYLMKFLDGFLNPLHRISTLEELLKLQTDHDSVLVGFFDFQGLSVSPGYKEFYKSALRALEKDPNRDVAFAVVTDVNTASKIFGIEHTPAANLYLWNETLIFPRNQMWNAENILNWMENSIHMVSLWLQPPGIKSSTLSPYLNDGPILLLFTPRNPLHDSNYNYDLLRMVSLEYYNCGDVLPAKGLIESLEKKWRTSAERHHQKVARCLQRLAESKTKTAVPSISIQRWINESCCSTVFLNKCLLCKREILSQNGMCSISAVQLDRICQKKDVFKLSSGKDEDEEEKYFCCSNSNSTDTNEPDIKVSRNVDSLSMNKRADDSSSAVVIRGNFMNQECIKILTGDKYHRPIFPNDFDKNLTVELTNSGCNANKSLAFIAIDSLQYFHFAEGLGINLLKMKDKTAVVILDSQEESQYLMSEIYNRDSLINFINNYNKRLLQRSLRSESSKRLARGYKSLESCDNIKSEICIPELNTNTFLNTILDPTKDVAVMYHSPYCAFCSAISYVYLTVANLLSKNEYIKFVRIDGDNNDLPWEYSMNRYPSILFFPAKRKEDNAMFPSSMQISIPNLLNFILSNLDGDKHIEALVNICHTGAGEFPEDCVTRIRHVCLDVIQKYLKSYLKIRRQAKYLSPSLIVNKQREILIKLEHIRDIHLILSSINNLEINDNYKLLSSKFVRYKKKCSQIIEKYFNSDGYKKTNVDINNDADDNDIKKRIINDEL